ncbi:GGDEF domain-containing protein [Halobacillus locisalis]|uniref:GGDEF domain-containing protein n=1 Tax=Halobacillus locisalis TaxID=220753 RepID=A0A838CTB0_9BACI|nr:sensor domain-containing diguanylate cyclase [Halobacillus locisalis]MBA2175059.1 GGDEF domain-containing protein [Halobacillus locisalis]
MQGIAQLLNHTSFLEQWLHSMNVAIAVIEQNNDLYTYTYMNEEMRKSFGECIGKTIEAVHTKEEVGVLARSLKLAGSGEGFSRAERVTVQSIPSTNSYILEWKKESVENNYKSMVEESPNSIIVHDCHNHLIYANHSGVELLGANHLSELLGRDVSTFIQNEPRVDIRNRLNKVLGGEPGSVLLERTIKRIDGRSIEIEMSGSRVEFNGAPAVQTLCRNISERRRKQSRLEEMAYYDQLTQVSNRRYFFNQLQVELEEVDENESILSLLFIDLDNFKDINDQYGHQVGDDVLVIFTKRVKQMLRDTDTFSRLGGDEFVVLLTNLQSSSDPEQVAERMIERVTQPIVIDEKELHISVSIGISIYPDHGTTREGLLTKADQALYEAKNNGRKCVEVYKHV